VLSLTVRPRDMMCDVNEDWRCRGKGSLCKQKMSRTRGLEGLSYIWPGGVIWGAETKPSTDTPYYPTKRHANLISCRMPHMYLRPPLCVSIQSAGLDDVRDLLRCHSSVLLAVACRLMVNPATEVEESHADAITLTFQPSLNQPIRSEALSSLLHRHAAASTGISEPLPSRYGPRAFSW
jgi:hypothetical protein